MDMSIQEEPIYTNTESTTNGKREKKNVPKLLLASVVTIILIGAFTSVYVMIIQLQISVQDLKDQIVLQKNLSAPITNADINECTSGTHNCHQHATCINTPGSFLCFCNENYTGNGKQCGSSFCSANVNLCQHNGTCSCNVWHTGEHCQREIDHVITTRKRNWANARKYCKSIGGDLATWGMRNATVRNWIITNLLQTRPDADYWIGINDIEQEGVWKYIDGVPTTTENSDFPPGEPNNDGTENCGNLRYKYGFKMNDLKCNVKDFAICERLLS